MANEPVKRPEEADDGMWTTMMWTGGALAVVAGLAVFAGMQG